MVIDHKHIDELDIVQRYLTGKLAAEETAEFEEHFVDCLTCVDSLETTKDFIDGLRRVASDRTPATVSHIPKGVPWSLPYTTSRKALAAAAGALSLVVVAGAVFVFSQIRRYRVDADQARSASSEWERRYQEERQLSAATSKDHQESERGLTEQVVQLRTELENNRKTAPRDNVQINLPILPLSSTRASDPQSAAANKLTLPRSASTFALVVGLEGEKGYRDYLMTILGSRNKLIWQGRGNKPNHDNAISASFNSTLFPSGDYLLTLEGVARDGSLSVVGKYFFRVVKSP